VVDVSGSMAGTSIEQVKQALHALLKWLTPNDRFNLIAFESTYDQLFEEVQVATRANLWIARKFVDKLKADGGTEILPALRVALQPKADPERFRQLIILTDGSIGNEQRILQDIHQYLGRKRLFTIGIGSAPNSHFMREAAVLGRGTFTYIGTQSETAERMLALFKKLERPAVTDVELGWHTPALLEQAEVYPTILPDLYHGEPVTFTAKLPNIPRDQLHGTLVLTGNQGNTSWNHEVRLARVPPVSGISKLWARHKIAQLMNDQRRGVMTAEEAKSRIVEIALDHHLVSRWTSLVAVDKTVVRPQGATLTTHHLATNLPAGWTFEKVFRPRTQLSVLVKNQRPTPAQSMPVVNPATLVALSLSHGATWTAFHVWLGCGLLLSGLLLLYFSSINRRAIRT